MRYLFFLLFISLFHADSRADIEKSTAERSSKDVSSSSMAVVNVQEVIKNSEIFKEIQKKMEDENREFNETVRKHQEKIGKEEKQLQSLQGTLSKKEFEKKRAQLAVKVENLQKMVEGKNREIQSSYQDLMLDFQDKVQKILEKLALKGKFSMVLDRQFILWSDNTCKELAPEVIKELNKEYREQKK